MESKYYGEYPEVRSEGTDNYFILESVDFFTDQIEEVRKSKNRVWIQTMALETGHFTNLLVHNLVEARKRGVNVRTVYDAFSDHVTDNTFNDLPLLSKADREYKKFLLNRNAELVDLLQMSGEVVKTNIPTGILRNTPLSGVAGRDHKKMSIIDDIAYIGGINMAPLDARRFDFMLKTDNKSIVDVLSAIFEQSVSGYPISESSYICDGNNIVLVDSGRPFESVIMQYANELIENENTSITLISPFLPSGHLRETLNKAVQKGVDVEIITSQLSQLGFTPVLSQFVHNLGQAKPSFSITRFPGVVHGKALLLGDHSAIVGSHNFDELFVKLGTEELALFTTHPKVISQVEGISERMRAASLNT